MSYSIRNGAFVSHLQAGREYKFTNNDERRAALALMLLDDTAVRDGSQKRAEQAGIKTPLTDRQIVKGDFMPDRRTTVERVADEVAAGGAKHDPYATAIDTVRGTQRLTDGPAKREADEATIQRLEMKSAELAQRRAAMPPAVDENTPAGTSQSMRAAAEQLQNSFHGTPGEQAQQRGRIEALLRAADQQDTKAVAESERAAKAKANEPWIADCDGVLYFVSTDPSIPQATVNAVKDFRQRLVNLETDGAAWIEFANGVDAQRKQIRADKVAAKNAEIAELEQQKTAIRAGTDSTPPAEPPAPEA